MVLCPQCGTVLVGAFCTKCGAATAGSAISTQPGNQLNRRRTSPIVWVLVVILSIIVLCGIGAAGVGYLVIHKAREAGITVDTTNSGIEIHSRDGGVKVNSSDSLPDWIPNYPGSRPSYTGKLRLESNGRMTGGATFETPDAAPQVLAFYQRRCKENGMEVEMESNGTDGGAVRASGRSFNLGITSNREHTIHVVANGRSGLTHVDLTFETK